MYTALALQLAHAPTDTVLDELRTVDPTARNAPRLLFLEAIVRIERGELTAAHDLLRGLAREDGPATTWRWLATVQLQLGKLDEAGVSLQWAQTDHSPSAEYQRLRYAVGVAVRDRDDAARDRLIAVVGRREPGPDGRDDRPDRWLAPAQHRFARRQGRDVGAPS
jgi:hypothetical protein